MGWGSLGFSFPCLRCLGGCFWACICAPFGMNRWWSGVFLGSVCWMAWFSRSDVWPPLPPVFLEWGFVAWGYVFVLGRIVLEWFLGSFCWIARANINIDYTWGPRYFQIAKEGSHTISSDLSRGEYALVIDTRGGSAKGKFSLEYDYHVYPRERLANWGLAFIEVGAAIFVLGLALLHQGWMRVQFIMPYLFSF